MFRPTAAERSTSLFLVMVGVALIFLAYNISKSKKDLVNGWAILPGLVGFGFLVVGCVKLF
jgi:hypothetical protein